MTVEVPTKSPYRSLTLWVNVLVAMGLVLGLIIEHAAGLEISPQLLESLVVALAAVNFLLRIFRTNLPLGPDGGTKTIEAPLPKEVG